MVYLLWLFAFFVSFFLAGRFIRPESRFHILDRPNHRSLHEIPVPRSGGIALLAGVLLSGLIAGFQYSASVQLGGLILGLLLVAGIGFWDDFSDVQARYRLLVQALAAALLIASGLSLKSFTYPGGVVSLPEIIGGVFSLLFIVWMVNLYNFMDGMDGLAGSMAFIGFGVLAFFGWMAGNELFFVLNGVVAIASLGFLLWNRPPARIFLGDAGSYGLGFMASAMLLWGELSEIFPFWIGMLVFSPFIIDATVTLVARLLRGQKIWEAHREHGYQILVQAGLGHGKTLVFYLLIMLLVGVSAIVAVTQSVPVQWGILMFWMFFYLVLFWSLQKWGYNRLRSNSRASGN